MVSATASGVTRTLSMSGPAPPVCSMTMVLTPFWSVSVTGKSLQFVKPPVSVPVIATDWSPVLIAIGRSVFAAMRKVSW